MAKRIANGAVISDSEEWYWTGTSWHPLASDPQSKPPDRDEEKRLPFLVREQSPSQVQAAGDELVSLIASLGGLTAAREELARRREASFSPDKPRTTPAMPERRSVDVQVKTYRNVKEYERDAPKMASAGWYPQGQTSQRGKVNMGRTIGKGLLFLPWAVMRPSRAGDPITVTWVRD